MIGSEVTCSFIADFSLLHVVTVGLAKEVNIWAWRAAVAIVGITMGVQLSLAFIYGHFKYVTRERLFQFQAPEDFILHSKGSLRSPRTSKGMERSLRRSWSSQRRLAQHLLTP